MPNINIKCEPIPLEERWQHIRDERDFWLQEADCCMLPDHPDNTQAMKDYRQKLRDIPQAFKTPEEVKFPKKP